MYKFLICIIFMHVTLFTSDISNLYQRRTGQLITPLIIPLLRYYPKEINSDFSDSSYQQESRKFFTVAENTAQNILFEELDAYAAAECLKQLEKQKTNLDQFSSIAQIHGRPVASYEDASLNCIDYLMKKYFSLKEKQSNDL